MTKTRTKTEPQTWSAMLVLDPFLLRIDRLIDSLQPTMDKKNPWPVYEQCRRELERRVGWGAPRSAPPFLTTSEAYQIGIDHICDRLGI